MDLLIVTVGIIALFAAGSNFSHTAKPDLNNQNRVYANQLVKALLAWEDDYGSFPVERPEAVLYPTYIDWEDGLYWIDPKTKKRVPWLYHSDILAPSENRSIPILAQPRPWKGKRIVALASGAIHMVREEDFVWPPETEELPRR